LDYELGFQLLEKNEENDKAVGVFGFQVGNQQLFAPVFFINGELRGHELLYMKESDTFVPLTEPWVNYIINRKPLNLGNEVNRNTSLLGAERPSMDIFRQSPGKYASAQPAWLLEGLPALANVLVNTTKTQPKLLLPDIVKQSAAAANHFIHMLDAYPTIIEPVVAVYGKQMVKDAIDSAKTLDTIYPNRLDPVARIPVLRGGSVFHEKTAYEQAVEDDPIRTGKLKIHVYDGTRLPGLTEKQAVDIKREGHLLVDDRTDASRVYRVQKPMTFNNPDQTGIYEVLTRPDNFEKCLYVHGPHGSRGQKPSGVLVTIDDAKRWCTKHPGEIFAISHHGDQDYADYFNDLPEAEELTRGATYLLLTPSGGGSLAFKVGKTLPSTDGEYAYEVWWLGDYARRPDHLPPVAERRYEYDNGYNHYNDTIVLGLTKGNRIVNRLGATYFPEGTKALKLKDPPKDYADRYPSGCEDSSDPPPLRVGGPVDIQLGLFKHSSELKVLANSTEANVNGQTMPLKQALFSLVKDYGLREKTAKEVLQNAEKDRGVRYRIKYAEPYELIRSAPSAPGFPDAQTGTDSFFGSQLPLQMYQEEELPVGENLYRGSPNEYDAAQPPSPQTMQNVMDAAQTGQKEVLDTSMLGTLLKGTRDDTLIDRYLSDLVKGLDRVGRLLFNFYWHHDKFEERYGESEIPDLEDALRNTFEGLGNLTIMLKSQNIEPYPDEDSGVDLSAQAEI
jgi:hypothetical protein